MTIPLPPALPPHFNIGGYKITALVESGPDYHLYQALSPEGHAVLIREFCPGGLVTRDLASGELAVFPENESQFAQAREAFETRQNIVIRNIEMWLNNTPQNQVL